MPLVSFTPTDARLVLEENKQSVLVMTIVLAKGESVELANGEKLEAFAGILRVRERSAARWTGDGNGVGSLVLVHAAQGATANAVSFQVNISMSSRKFDTLLKVAISGRLPTKLFIDAGEKISRTKTRGISYRLRPRGRTKVWDTRSSASVLVTNFTAILPIALSERAHPISSSDSDRLSMDNPASYRQVADLGEDLKLFRSETHYTLMVIVSLFVVIALLTLVYNLSRLFW